MYKKILIGALLASSLTTIAQVKTSVAGKEGADSAKKVAPKIHTKKGLFTVVKIADKYFFEIPDTLLKRDILVVTRYSKTPGNTGVYGGELVNEQSVYLEKGPDKKMFLRVSIQVNRSKDSTQAIYQAIKSANLDPIVAAFDIKGLSDKGDAYIIEVTDYMKGDNPIFSVTPDVKKKLRLGGIAMDRSYISGIDSYPINTEIRTVKTFFATPAVGPVSKIALAADDPGVVTLELNTSFLLLPKVPMKKRYKDDRVGYFADEITVYNDDSQQAKKQAFIVRWKMEPKDQDLAKFKRGELVEPKKPIVYYIDPATPQKWKKYLIAGVNDWQKAFEQAGFKNAIVAKEWPVNDSTMSMEDARYSVIRYFASAIPNAYGPNVHDPRSGEILESHIGWYHNVMQLIQNMYMVQAGPLDPRAQKMVFSDELMGELIRFVSSHEIGHTLGLRHNMGSSSQTPVEKLRDKAWVEANGHTVSIMDYARFNYVAQPEDKISPKGLLPRIGEYDKWAIEWGYKPMFEKNEQEEQKKLFKMTTARLLSNPRLWFGGEGDPNDPRSSAEDLGDNAMKASDYGILNLKRVVMALPVWTKQEGEMYSSYSQIYAVVLKQYNTYTENVLKNIGGTYFDNKSFDEPGNRYTAVPKELQKQALNYMDRQVFQTPDWLINEDVIAKLGVKPLSLVRNIQFSGIQGLLGTGVLTKVMESAKQLGDPYTLDEYLGDIRKMIWRELGDVAPISEYRRSLQLLYIERLGNIIDPDGFKTNFSGKSSSTPVEELTVNFTDIPGLLKQELRALKSDIDRSLLLKKDKMTIYHLKYIHDRIESAIK